MKKKDISGIIVILLMITLAILSKNITIIAVFSTFIITHITSYTSGLKYGATAQRGQDQKVINELMAEIQKMKQKASSPI